MTLANDGNCFRCGEPGHWADHCPLNYPATSKAEHEGRIAAIVERWIDWRRTGMTTQEKRRLIEAENELWNNREQKKQKTGARK